MELADRNQLHPGAMQWYYGCVQRGLDVPEAFLDYLRQYLAGRKLVDDVNEAVTGAGGKAGGRSKTRTAAGGNPSGRSGMKRDVIDTLSLHFQCLNEQVTCSRVRPFLPTLLLPSVRIRIPTPITVHVDHCPQCAQDLAALRELALGPQQLQRLERLYARPSAAHPQLCRRARSTIAAFVRGACADLDEEIRDHLCTCPRCRARVRRSRQRLLTSDAPTAGDCPTAAARLFDYVVPFGHSDENGGPTVAETPYDHVRTCRTCRQKIQDLDDMIYGIATRADSGIATIYSAQPEAREIPGAVVDSYPGYPIHVQVVPAAPVPVPASTWPPAGVRAALKRSTCDPRVRLILKSAVAAAAVIPLAVLFFNTSTAEGVTLGQLFHALGKAPNVHVSTFHERARQQVEDLWISRGADCILMVKGQTRILHDLKARTESIFTAGTLSSTAQLDERRCAGARQLRDGCLGFTLRDVPADAKWTRVGNSSANAGYEVYELTYTKHTDFGTALLKLDISVDLSTRLPREVQAFRRSSTEELWHHMSRTELHYPTEEEMAAIVGSR